MILNKPTLLFILMLFALPAQADLYLELGFESGGDELIGTNTGDDLHAGGGLKLALGIQNPVNEDGTAWLRMAVGYLFDDINADNGEADIDTLTFDALYILNAGMHSFGVGPTLHLDPEYSDDVAGFRPERIEFDDAVGIMFQYGYHPTENFEIGLRLTDIDYENGSRSYDAGSFGLFISNGF